MILSSIFRRSINKENFDSQVTYLGKLGEFTSSHKETHIVEGQFAEHPDQDSIAGLSVNFSEDNSQAGLLVLADDDGLISLYDTANGGQTKLLTKFRAHRMTIFDVEWVPGRSQVITASGDQTACLVDLISQTVVDSFHAHTGSLRCVSSRKIDSCVFATGGRDALIAIWDTRVSRRGGAIHTVNEIKPAHLRGRASRSINQSVTGLAFQDENTLISCASNDSNIKVWDLRRCYKTMKCGPSPKHMYTYQGHSQKNVSYSDLTLDSARCSFFVNCTDDVIYRYDCLGYKDEVIQTYKGHENRSFFIKSSLSPCDQLLVTGSSDNQAHIYHVKSGEAVGRLEGHQAEVSNACWDPHQRDKIVTLSDDDTMRVWRMNKLNAESLLNGRCTTSQKSIFDFYTPVRDYNRVYSHTIPKPKADNVHTPPSQKVLDSVNLKALPPWPRLSEWEFAPRISSPIKLIISPRKTASQRPSPRTHRAASAPIKRNLLNHMNESPKAKRARIGVTTQSQFNTGEHGQTLSPIRINNKSLSVINITPKRTKRLSMDGDMELVLTPVNNPICTSPSNQSSGDKENSDKNENWLTRHSRELRRLSETPDTPKVKSARGSGASKQSGPKTPTTGTKKNAVTSCNILKYFSPTSREITSPKVKPESHVENEPSASTEIREAG